MNFVGQGIQTLDPQQHTDTYFASVTLTQWSWYSNIT